MYVGCIQINRRIFTTCSPTVQNLICRLVVPSWEERDSILFLERITSYFKVQEYFKITYFLNTNILDKYNILGKSISSHVFLGEINDGTTTLIPFIEIPVIATKALSCTVSAHDWLFSGWQSLSVFMSMFWNQTLKGSRIAQEKLSHSYT